MTLQRFIVLLLILVKPGSSQDEDCAAAVIGELAVLPCTYDGTRRLLSSNFSAWWRTEKEDIFRGLWKQGHEETLNVSNSKRARMLSLAPQTGNLSMMLTEVVPSDANTYSLHVSFDGENTSSVLCTVCLRVGAHYSFPAIEREEEELEDNTQFVCHTRGGYPKPILHWLINSTDKPPPGSVKTYAQPLQDSELFNITSIMTVSIGKHIPVTCAVENRILNETFSTINWPEKERFSPVVARASEAMWVFSMVLIIIVGILVAVGLGFQVKWGHERRRPHLHEDDSDSEDTDITVDMERLESLTETDV